MREPTSNNPISADKKLHLEMIQAVINRLSHNSFLLKGWLIVLLAALISVSFREKAHYLLLISLYPLSMFWSLDGYFLSLERQYRGLFDHVRNQVDGEVNLSMALPLSIRTKHSWFKAFLSKTLLAFYGGNLMFLVLLIVLAYLSGAFVI